MAVLNKCSQNPRKSNGSLSWVGWLHGTSLRELWVRIPKGCVCVRSLQRYYGPNKGRNQLLNTSRYWKQTYLNNLARNNIRQVRNPLTFSPTIYTHKAAAGQREASVNSEGPGKGRAPWQWFPPTTGSPGPLLQQGGAEGGVNIKSSSASWLITGNGDMNF